MLRMAKWRLMLLSCARSFWRLSLLPCDAGDAKSILSNTDPVVIMFLISIITSTIIIVILIFSLLPRHETPNSDRRRSHAAEYCAGCAAKRRLLSGSCNIILRYLRAHSQRQGHGLEQIRARECSRHVSKPAPWSCVRVFVRVCVCVCVCVCKHHYKRQDLCVCFTRVPQLVS